MQEKSHSRFVLTAEGRDVREHGSAEFRVHGEVKRHETGISMKQLQASVAMPVCHECPVFTTVTLLPACATYVAPLMGSAPHGNLNILGTFNRSVPGDERRAAGAKPCIASIASLDRGESLSTPHEMCCRKCWARTL